MRLQDSPMDRVGELRVNHIDVLEYMYIFMLFDVFLRSVPEVADARLGRRRP
jgi:hypothetical protein